MAGNPLIAQGNLNRLIGSALFSDHPELNVSAAFLSKAGISIEFQGEATTVIETLTGTVNSPEPYMRTAVVLNLLKTQALSATFKAQLESSSLLGPLTVRPDTTIHPPYSFENVSIRGIRGMETNGENPAYVVELQGYYLINSALWNLV